VLADQHLFGLETLQQSPASHVARWGAYHAIAQDLAVVVRFWLKTRAGKNRQNGTVF
jgi:hypothetical protein